MKYKFTFNLNKPLKLPIQYNHILQASIMNWINDDTYREFLHNKGYSVEKRSYKLYTFSKIFGKFRLNREDKSIIFYDEIHIYLSSYDAQFINYVVNNIIINRPLNLWGTDLFAEKIEIIAEQVKNCCTVKTLSPITIYSTIETEDHHKQIYYHSPYDEKFEELIRKNLIHKYQSYHERLPGNCELRIRLLREGKKSLVFYKGMASEAWNGIFQLEGSEELIQMALDAGLGGRNSIGFGCILTI